MRYLTGYKAKPPEVSQFVNDFTMGMKRGSEYPRDAELAAKQLEHIKKNFDELPYVSKNPLVDRMEIERYLAGHALYKYKMDHQSPNPDVVKDLVHAVEDCNKALVCLYYLENEPDGYERVIKATCKDPKNDFHGIYPKDDCRKFLDKQIDLLGNVAIHDPVASMRVNSLMECSELYTDAQHKKAKEGYKFFRPNKHDERPSPA